MENSAKVFFEKLFHKKNRLQLVQGDITREVVDAIVNAANSHLQHGGGVAAALVRAGGEIIQEESDSWVRKYGPITHATPAYTSAGRLNCRYIIHAVGPIWGEGDEEAKLHETIRSCLLLAEKLSVKSIAFPAISTGIYGFPIKKAAPIFREEFFHYFNEHVQTSILLIRLVLRDRDALSIFLEEFQRGE